MLCATLCCTRGHWFLRICHIVQLQYHSISSIIASSSRASSIMNNSPGIERLDDRECSFGHFWITPKQEQDDWSSPVNETHNRDSAREFKWAITPVAKVEDPRTFEDQYLMHDMNSFQELPDLNKPHHMKEFEHGEVQIVESTWEHNTVFSPAPLSARAPIQNPSQSSLSLQRPIVTARGGPPIAAFTVQCSQCLKWRMIPTKEQYEAIRQCILEQPWVCENAYSWRPGASCEDPTDFSQDSGALWAIDRPNIPRPPPGWERKLVIRSEGSTKFADIYYHSPCGKKLRSMVEVDKFLKEHPEYVSNGVNLHQFSYTTPQPLKRGYVRPKKSVKEANGHSTTSKFLLHQTLVKQLRGSNYPSKAMRGSLKSRSAPTAVCPAAERFMPRSNVLRENLASPCDLQIVHGDGGIELPNGQTTKKKGSFLRFVCENDCLPAHIKEAADACANGPNIISHQESLGHLQKGDNACTNEPNNHSYQDAADFRQQRIYPFAGCSNSICELPQFLKKKRRTIRLSSIIDQESSLSNWNLNEQDNILGSSTFQ